MRNSKFLKRAGAVLIAGVMAFSSAAPAFAQTSDTVDVDADVSLHLKKYDITAYETVCEVNGETAKTWYSSGQQNDDAEETLANYAIAGVEFTIVDVGEVHTYSNAGYITVVYDLPDSLIEKLAEYGDLDTTSQTAEGDIDTSKPVEVDGVTCYTSDAINEAMQVLLSGTGENGHSTVAGKNALEQWAASYTGTKYVRETDKDGCIDLTTDDDGLSTGLYLLIETKVPEEVVYTTDPFFVSLPMTDNATNTDEDDAGDYWFYDVYVYPKNQTNNPTIDKLVADHDVYEQDAATALVGGEVKDVTDAEGYFADYETVSEGDVLDYRIVMKLPTITSEATYLTKWVVEDIADMGLEYNEDVVIYFYNDKDTADQDTDGSDAIYTWSPAAGTEVVDGYTDAYTYADWTSQKTSGTTVNTMTVTVTDAGLAELNSFTDGDNYSKYSDMYMVIAYTMTVDSSSEVTMGDTGNANTSTLTWSRTNMDYENSIEDEVKVFTYGINQLLVS